MDPNEALPDPSTLDRLDALLSNGGLRRDEDDRASSERSEPLAPLLSTMDTLREEARSITPSADFSRALRARYLAMAAARRASSSSSRSERRVWASLQWVARAPRARVAAIAAALALVVTGGLLASAMSAPPASPLYGVRRVAESVQAQAAPSEADRVRLHITYADQALSSLQDAARQGQLAEFHVALSTMQDEDDAAAATVASLAPGEQRSALEMKLGGLRARERDGLWVAAALVGWQDRVATTLALGRLGAPVPRALAAGVSKQYKRDDGQHVWRVTLTGAGFQPGAVLLVDGLPDGKVVSLSDGALVAEIQDGPLGPHVMLGVGNPDFMAAVTSLVTREKDDPPPPTQGPAIPSNPTPTATPAQGNGGDGGNPHSGTPTPTHTHSSGAGKP